MADSYRPEPPSRPVAAGASSPGLHQQASSFSSSSAPRAKENGLPNQNGPVRKLGNADLKMAMLHKASEQLPTPPTASPFETEDQAVASLRPSRPSGGLAPGLGAAKPSHDSSMHPGVSNLSAMQPTQQPSAPQLFCGADC